MTYIVRKQIQEVSHFMDGLLKNDISDTLVLTK